MASVPRAALPHGLPNRPWDDRRAIPVPLFNETPEGPDYTAIHAPTVVETAEENRCGVCGDPLDYWIAFVGGPRSAASRLYQDPPLHPACAVAALTLCPHLRLTRHRRAPEHRRRSDETVATGAYQGHVEQVVIGITRSFKTSISRGGLTFKAAPFKRTIECPYDEDGQIIVPSAARALWDEDSAGVPPEP